MSYTAQDLGRRDNPAHVARGTQGLPRRRRPAQQGHTSRGAGIRRAKPAAAPALARPVHYRRRPRGYRGRAHRDRAADTHQRAPPGQRGLPRKPPYRARVLCVLKGPANGYVVCLQLDQHRDPHRRQRVAVCHLQRRAVVLPQRTSFISDLNRTASLT